MFICAAAGNANAEAVTAKTAIADFISSPWVEIETACERSRVSSGRINQISPESLVKTAKRSFVATVTRGALALPCGKNHDRFGFGSDASERITTLNTKPPCRPT